MANPVERIRSKLSSEDRATLAEIMARNRLTDDDAVLMVIAECLLTMTGMRQLVVQQKAISDQARASAEQCANAAALCNTSVDQMRSQIANPEVVARAGEVIAEASLVMAKRLAQLDDKMAKALRPRWFFMVAGLVGALAVAGPLWWRLDDLRRADTIILSAQGGRIDKCTIPAGMPVQHDDRNGRYVFCQEKEPLK